MRQSGRTSRIVDFTIDQLFSVGECITTDHYVFEYPDAGEVHLKYFIDKVKARWEAANFYEQKTLSHTIIRIGNTSLVHFKIKLSKDENT